ncbi:hypothetical protein [Paenibacillus oceani]|uniref:Uncharacterized protein n=1 Tax=Paenibacillus oceani TaxID=2772510 RepID=A0A927CA63_9BACL|nr:hypothetical protein [Paenibacillus oceani]MBD2862962.1 hypothetical protein [Paenibacillus oceani]
MNEPKPEWYEQMRNDPFDRRTFTLQNINRIEKMAADGRAGSKRNGRPKPVLWLAAGVVIVLLLLIPDMRATVGLKPWSGEAGTETNPPAERERYRLKGDVEVTQSPGAYEHGAPVFVADADLSYEVTEIRGNFAKIASGGASGWIPEWYLNREPETGALLSVKPYEMLVLNPVVFRLYPDEAKPSGFELPAGKVVQVTREYRNWANIRLFTYDTPYTGEKWVPKSALAAFDPASAREGTLREGAGVYTEKGGAKERPPSPGPIWIEREAGSRYVIIAPGGYTGYIEKADFVPNPFRDTGSEGRAESGNTEEEETALKEDLSHRAVGTHTEGRIVVKPSGQAKVAALGAPSCYGQETDLNWRGAYEAVWEPKSGGAASPIFSFPTEFEIIQKNDSPVQMKSFALSGTDLFAYVPRHTDCHALETYLFGVSDGKAFPVPFEMDPERSWTNIGQLPNRQFQVTSGEMIVTGGYGAGQDYIDVYHFRYDSKKKAMVLQRTEQLKPNEING